MYKVYQTQHRHFHHTLIEISSSVFDNLHRDNLLSLDVLAFYDLAEGPLTEHVKYEVSGPTT